jgi:DNA-binding PadR family transcriptional regulator
MMIILYQKIILKGVISIITKFLTYLSDPLSAKLIIEIQEQGEITASKLLERFYDIPQATLYRRLQKMLKDGVLKVVAEHPIRGTVEKVYALGFNMEKTRQELGESNNGDAYMQMVTYYVLGILQEFREYTTKEEIDLAGDGSGCSVAPVYATHEELMNALMKIGEIITELQSYKPDGKRRLHNLCIITTPPKN